MLSWSISSTEAMPTPDLRDLLQLGVERLALSSSGKFFESSIPRGKCLRSRITAAATTGPASGAQPASSTPASGSGNSRSSLKQGSAIESARLIGPQAEVASWPVTPKICGSVDPPRREAARFAGLVEEDDIARRDRAAAPRATSTAGCAGHARTACRSRASRSTSRVEVVAFEIDRGAFARSSPRDRSGPRRSRRPRSRSGHRPARLSTICLRPSAR